MRVEPLYGLPVEEPGDVEGWSVNSGQPGDLLADAVAVELNRIETIIDNFEAAVAPLPTRIQSGLVVMPVDVFVSVPNTFYNAAYIRGAQGVLFEEPFDEPPAVVVLPANTPEPGFTMECSASNVSTSGFTARLAVTGTFIGGAFVARWIAAERTQ